MSSHSAFVPLPALSLRVSTFTSSSSSSPSPSHANLRPRAARRMQNGIFAVTDDLPPLSKGRLAVKYGHLRGAKVETVSDALVRFNESFRRPVPIVYRTLVNEAIVSTHLSRVCAMWKYCNVFAFGLDELFQEFFRYYPGDEERELLYTSVCVALKFEKDKIRADAKAVRDWCVGKSEEDIVSACESGEGPVGSALKQAVDGEPQDEWYYSRPFGLGFVRVMEALGMEIKVEVAEAFCERLKLPKSKISAELGNYISTVERLKQAEQVFAEVAARDARKTAERLAEKAEKAKKAAARIEAGEEDDEQDHPGGNDDAKADEKKKDPSSSESSAPATVASLKTDDV